MAEISLSSSTSISTQIQAKNDVFLSFRGEDVRNNFISHLHAALCRKGIGTFIDYELKRGEEISPALLKAIEDSSISIVIFSENYAKSKWCLNELLKILECRKVNGQIVVPIFYHVDPSHIRKQERNYAEAFMQHEETLKDQKNKIQLWKEALTESANLTGWDLPNYRPESTFIEEITRYILKKLNKLSSMNADGLVGIETRVLRIEHSLGVGLDDVHILGIWGMGGIGKTTTARALFNKISSQFEGFCFLENIREDVEKHGLQHLQKKLLSVLLEEENLSMDISLGFFKDRLCRKKILIVLDDIDDKEQLEYLVGGHDWFAVGSRIIITTRDKHVLNGVVDKVYKAQQFVDTEALQLFSQHAFRKSYPPKEYLNLSKKAIDYAGGIPLALKVLGSCLFGKSIQTWTSELASLEKLPNKKIQNVLKVSFDGLRETEKNLLLDVVCFFKWKTVNYVRAICDGCGYFTNASLDVLIDKSLLYITKFHQLGMHDLIQEMGKDIVRQEDFKEPGRRSRLWDHGDIYHVFKNNTGTEAVEGIFLDLSTAKELKLGEEAFTKMYRLRLLKFFSEINLSEFRKISLPRGLTTLSDDLRCLHWDGYPYKALPSKFHPGNLVDLCLAHSSIKQLWKGHIHFKHLKRINLSHSKNLSEVPDLSGAQHLESIVLMGCLRISTIHPSINTLSNLESLDLRGCKNLRYLPNSIHLKSLRTWLLCGCSNLRKFPEISGFMEHLSRLYIVGTAISNLPSSIENLTGLQYLDLENNKKLVSLPDSICNLKHLSRLILSGCKNLNKLPENIGNLESLAWFNASGTSIEILPSSTVGWKNIVSLTFPGGTHLCSWNSFFWSLLLPGYPMGFQPSPLWGLWHLKLLILCYRNIVELPTSLDRLSSLVVLSIDGNNFERLPQSIRNLPQLRILTMSYCKRLRSLPEIPPTLLYLEAHECTSLEPVVSFGKVDRSMNQTFKLDKREFECIMKRVIQRVHYLVDRFVGFTGRPSCSFQGRPVDQYPDHVLFGYEPGLIDSSSVLMDSVFSKAAFEFYCDSLNICSKVNRFGVHSIISGMVQPFQLLSNWTLVFKSHVT